MRSATHSQTVFVPGGALVNFQDAAVQGVVTGVLPNAGSVPLPEQRQPLRLPLLRRAAEHGECTRRGRPQRLPQHVRLDEPGDRQGASCPR